MKISIAYLFLKNRLPGIKIIDKRMSYFIGYINDLIPFSKYANISQKMTIRYNFDKILIMLG